MNFFSRLFFFLRPRETATNKDESESEKNRANLQMFLFVTLLMRLITKIIYFATRFSLSHFPV